MTEAEPVRAPEAKPQAAYVRKISPEAVLARDAEDDERADDTPLDRAANPTGEPTDTGTAVRALHQDVVACLLTLPDEERVILHMRYWEECPMTAIGIFLRNPEAAQLAHLEALKKGSPERQVALNPYQSAATRALARAKNALRKGLEGRGWTAEQVNDLVGDFGQDPTFDDSDTVF
ncbi:MAG: hypothetical protein HY329_24510 [Chloroflexi bacterium]|nr:hypothetical protein [Chloroflexota bacterium]